MIDILISMGGAERNLCLLVHGLRKRGHKVIVCCLKGGELTKEMDHDGFHVVDLNVDRIYGLDGMKALYRIAKIAKKEKASVMVSYHESSDYLGVAVGLLTGLPIVSSRRDMGFKLKPRHVWAYRLVNRFFDHIATVSAAVKKMVVDTQEVHPVNVTVIPNGVSFHAAAHVPGACLKGPKDGWPSKKHLSICCVANIRPIKGLEHLVEAAGLVVQGFPFVRFYLVGKILDNDPYYREIRRRVTKMGLENVVEFTDELQHDEIRAFLSSVDICVCSSLSEGMSNAILESMSSGKPVVATAVGGNPEIVQHAKTGLLVPPANPKAMAEALLKLLVNDNLRHEMGLHARSRVESEFSVDRMVARYEDLFKYVCLKRKLGKWYRWRLWLLNQIQCVRGWGKTFVASAIYHSGLVAAVRTVKRALHLGNVNILCFHEISERAQMSSDFSIVVHSAHFRQLLRFLVRNYQIVSLREAVGLLENGQRLSEDVFALTFDDCYKGWIRHVFPLCQRLQAPFAGFVATQPLDSGPLLYDALIFLARNTWRKVADLSRWGSGVFLLGDSDHIHSFVEETNLSWRGRSRKDRNQFLEELSVYLGVSLNSEEFRDTLLDWDDLRKMDASGVTIGAHSVSHAYFPDLPEAECSWEIYESKRRLEQELGDSIDFFAYPYGIHKAHDCDIVKKSGFLHAFTLDAPNNNPIRAFEIPRRSVSLGMFADPHRKFNEALLATELCGLGDIIFGRVFTKRRDSAAGTYK